MNDPFVLVNVVLLTVVSLSAKSAQECVCNTRIRGEYCGIELNKKNGNTDCLTNQIYFCGPNNRDKAAMPLITCQDENECGQSRRLFTGRARWTNSCIRRLKCQCPTDMGRGRHCGSELIGDDCSPNIQFRCGFGGRVQARDVCPNGCLEGKCVGSDPGTKPQEPESEDIPEDVEDDQGP